jgi:peptide/nickel transport system ATP-binding protein
MPPEDGVTPEDIAPLLEIESLQTHIRLRQGTVRAVDGVSLHVARGETLGLVGESGCGKTMTALSVMGLLPPGGEVAGGTIRLDGREISGLRDQEMRKIRGAEIGMIFQDPLTSLNPTMTVGGQIAEAVLLHQPMPKARALQRAADVLGLVGLPKPRERLAEYPHQFSGGMRQRVMIAMALACEPKLLIADEPTTALDVTIQQQILELIDDLRQRLRMAVILVTHDLGVIAGSADRVAVMYAGTIAENASTRALFDQPRHPYTEALFQSLPNHAVAASEDLYSIPGTPPDLTRPVTGCRFAPRCRYARDECERAEPSLAGGSGGDGSGDGHAFACFFPVSPDAPALAGVPATPVAAANPANPAGTAHATSSIDDPVVLSVQELVKDFPVTHGVLQRRAGAVSAVAGVSFDIRRGETFGLVGESGCGKSTIGRLIARMERPTGGTVRFEGTDLAMARGRGGRELGRKVQYMFQDSYSAMNPRMRAGMILAEPLVVQGIGDRPSQRERVSELLGRVGLPRDAAERYPHEFSGGQRQRLGFARALVLSPDLIVADEPVSALDVSIQAQILNLMRELQRELGLTYMFISHDLSVVRYLSTHIGVMYLGKMVEAGPAEEVYLTPAHPYTRGLIAAAPVPDPRAGRAGGAGVRGELPSALHPPSGCRFHTRCPLAQDICAEEEPPPRPFSESGHQAACHFPLQPALAPG